MSLLLLGNRPSKTVLALFSQTWHWELLFTWPSASTRNKAVYSIHELAPPVLFILGGITLPAFLGNGYFQADGRSCRKLWSRLMWEPLDLIEARHLCESYDIPSPPELKTIPFWVFLTVLLQHFLVSLLRQKHSGEFPGVHCSSRRHRADSNRSFSVTSLAVNLACRVTAGVSCVHCLKAMRRLQTLLKPSRVFALT